MRTEASKLNGKEPPMSISLGGRRDPCPNPNCRSKSGCETYSDGHRYCHKCGDYFPSPYAKAKSRRTRRMDKAPKKNTGLNLPVRGLKRFKKAWDGFDRVERGTGGYIDKKGIRGVKHRQRGDDTVVSRVRSIDGEIVGLQYTCRVQGGIVKKSKKHPDGKAPDKFKKTFAPGTKPKGGMEWFGRLDDAKKIYVAEGLATTETIFDAGKRKTPAVCAYSAHNVPEVAKLLNERFPDADIILAVDQDEAGEKAVEDTLRAVPNATIKVATPGFNRPRKARNDFNDLACLKGKQAVRNRLRKAKKARPEYAGPLAVIHTWNEFRSREFPPVEDAMGVVLQWPGITQIAGFRGDGKTWLILYLCVALACGVDVFGWACKRAYKVLIVDGELPPWTLQERIEAVIADLGVEPAPGMLNVFSTYDSDSGTLINLTDPSQTQDLYERCSQFEVVCFDNFSALSSGVDPNAAESHEPFNTLSMRLRGAGLAVIRVVHLGKDKSRGARGSSRQEDPLDFGLVLERQTLSTFHGNDVIRITCNKTRHHSMNEFKPIDLEFSQDKNGRFKIDHELVYKSKTDALVPVITELMEAGEWEDVQREGFADKHGVNRTTVYRAGKKAKGRIEQKGLLHE